MRFPLLLLMMAQAAFQSASVKAVPGRGGNTVLSPPGAEKFSATSVTMDVLIELAYSVDENRIENKPAWLGSQKYDVEGVPAGAGGLSYDELRPLVRELLERKFGLRVHRETKDLDGYELVVAGGGPKLQVSDGTASKKYVLAEGIYFQNTSLATFAAGLELPVKKPVADKTGITGRYDMRLDLTDDTVFHALEKQLGLRLEAKQIPVEFLAIDHVEREPIP